MIVCHCRNITDRDIRAAVEWMRAADPMTIVTPGKIYHALGQRADCGGCMPLFLATMRESAGFQVPANLLNLRKTAKSAIDEETDHEGRRESHRISERRTAV